MFSPPLSDNLDSMLPNRDGLIETVALLDLDLPDTYIIQNLHKRIQQTMDWYNQKTGFNLSDKRLKNLRMIKGDQIEENALYHYQTKFKDNEIFVGVDAIIAYITASLAGLEVYPAGKKEQNKIFAKDTLSYMKGHSEEHELDAELESLALDLQAQYFGCLKLEWKPNYGEKGEIIPRSVNPAHLIIAKHTKRGSNPAFICEVLRDSVEGLISKFPKKEQDILKLFGIKRKGSQNVSKDIAYRECWFTYYDSKNKPQEAVCWYVQNLVLEKSKSPNWLYKGEGENFLKAPLKPYIPFNLFNDGNQWIDFTSAVEQAVPVQDILNKEGRQIIDNLSTANGFRIVLAGAMTDDALENLSGDPNQSVIVKGKTGQTIDDIYKQIEPHLVSEELIADKNSNRDIIHSILGTPSQFRGDDTDQTKTASEAQMIKNQASGRQDKIVRSFNRGIQRYYQYLAQMITVYYTESHDVTSDGGDGMFDFIEMHQNKIEKGMSIHVKSEPSGDKARRESIAQNGAEIGYIAPIDWYKMMSLQDPQKLMDNAVKWKTSPQALIMDGASDEQVKDAIMDFEDLMAGKKPPQRDDINPAYLDQFRKSMISDEFLDPKRSSNKIKRAVIEFANTAMLRLAIRTEIDEASNAPLPPEPLPPEVQATLPPPQPPMQQPMPGMGMPQQPGQPMAPQAPMGMPPQQPGQMPMQPQMQPPMAPSAPQQVMGTPLPQVGMASGIQGVMQQANAPNLNPQLQPTTNDILGSLTPR